MPEGIHESRIAFDLSNGHDHDNVNSKRIDFSNYTLYDFISKQDLESAVRSIVNSGSISPIGGIYLGDPDGSNFVHLGPEIPGPGSEAQLTITAGTRPDGTGFMDATWKQVDNADHWLIEMWISTDGVGGPYRSTDSQILDGEITRFIWDNILHPG